MSRDIDNLIASVRSVLPSIAVSQHVPVAGEDDGIWWFSLPSVTEDVQVEPSYIKGIGDGMCPFLIETNEQCSGEALRASTVEEATRLIVEYLRGTSEGRLVHLQGERFWNQKKA